MSDKPHDLTEILRLHGGAPDHLPAFKVALAASLDDADREMGRAVGGAGWLRRRKTRGERRPRLALAAAVAAIIVAAAVLIGLPAGQRVMERFFGGPTAQGPVFPGPEPATAADVARIAEQALRSTHTITADSAFWCGHPGDEPEFTSRFRVILAADHSSRAIGAYGSYAGGAVDISYDARSGVEHVWGWTADPAGPSVDFFLEEYVGVPPGEPDGSWLPVGDSLNDFWYPGAGGGGTRLFGAVARVARANADGAVETGVFDGRPVWIVSGPVTPNSPYENCSEERMPTVDPLGYGSASSNYKLSVSVDQETGLPVRVQSWVDDELVAEARLVNLRVTEPVPDDTFAPSLPTAVYVRPGDDDRLNLWVDLGAAARVMPLPFDPQTVSPEDVRVSLPDAPGIREDHGFRRMPLEQVATAIGRAALVPAWMPEGFQLGCVAVKLKQGQSEHSREDTAQATAATGIVALRYEAGFLAITVTTRELDPRFTTEKSAIDLDPFIGDAWPGWDDSRSPFEVTSGAFAGARGNVVIAPLTIPHLWAFKDGMLLTVAGDATAEELLAIAGSIEPWDAHAESQLPTPGSTGG